MPVQPGPHSAVGRLRGRSEELTDSAPTKPAMSSHSLITRAMETPSNDSWGRSKTTPVTSVSIYRRPSDHDLDIPLKTHNPATTDGLTVRFLQSLVQSIESRPRTRPGRASNWSRSQERPLTRHFTAPGERLELSTNGLTDRSDPFPLTSGNDGKHCPAGLLARHRLRVMRTGWQ